MQKPASARILVVDNDEEICKLLRLMLQQRSYTVQVAEGIGLQLLDNAVAKAQEMRPHIAVVDLRLLDDYMNDQSGLRLLPYLQSARCILYSGHLGAAVTHEAARKYNIFAWVDKSNHEALTQAIREAATEMSATARPAQVTWPPGCAITSMVKKLIPNHGWPAEDFTIFEDVIAQLFPANHDFTLETIAGSDALPGTFLRGRSLVTKIYADNFGTKVLKLASAAAARDEAQNYERYVQNWMPGLHATRLEKSVTFWDLGGTIYSFMGLNDRVLPTFAQHYAAKDHVERIVQPLRHFFTKTWQPHYANRQLVNESLFTTYDKLFQLEERWSRIDPALLVDLRRKLGANRGDPVAWVQQNQELSWFPEVWHAVTHGDLHGDNLFIEGEQAWIIDFERTGPSHALRDFAELEVDIYTRLAAHHLDWQTLEELATALVAPTQPEQPANATLMLSVYPEATKALTIINAVRQLALEVTPYTDQREYLWALLLDALYVASVRPIDAQQRQRALLYASVICERLQSWRYLPAAQLA